MDVLIDNMLQKQEIDFLAAYRGHMIKVQKEIVMFKKLLSEQQFKIKRDKTVATLQKSFTWFRDEALNLSKLYEKKKDQFKQVRVNNQILEDDREFLEEALRNTKRENLHMRETLRQQNDKMRNLLTIIRELQEQFKNQGNQVQQNANINDILSDVQEGLGDIDETLVNKKSRTRSKILKSMDNRSYKQMISPQVKERFDHTIDNQDLKQDGHEIFLNTQVEIKDSNQNARSFLQRQQIVQLKNELARSSQTNEFENIFRQCVNQVKSDSIKNSQKSQSRVRLKSAVQTERSSRDFNRTTTMISSNQNLKDDNISLSTAKRDDLKAHQKRQVLDLFIKNEFVFNNIYNQMFPQRSQQTPRDQNLTLSGGNISLDNMKFLSETTQDKIGQPFILSPTKSTQSGIFNNNYNSTNINFYVGQSQNTEQILQPDPDSTSFRYAQIKSGKLLPRASFINEKQQLKLDQRIKSGRDLRNFKVNQQIHLYNPSEQTLLNLKTSTAADSNSKVNQSRPFSSYDSTSNSQNLRVSKRFNQSKREVSASFNFSNKN
eukprot:403335070